MQHRKTVVRACIHVRNASSTAAAAPGVAQNKVGGALAIGHVQRVCACHAGARAQVRGIANVHTMTS